MAVGPGLRRQNIKESKKKYASLSESELRDKKNILQKKHDVYAEKMRKKLVGISSNKYVFDLEAVKELLNDKAKQSSNGNDDVSKFSETEESSETTIQKIKIPAIVIVSLVLVFFGLRALKVV